MGSLYRNPNERVEWVDRFEKFIDVVLNEGKEIILLGDFNKDLLDADANREWLILTESLGLTQLVTEPTRVTAVTGPDSSSGRASASGSEGRRFDPRPRHTKGVKMVLVAPLLMLAIKG